MRVLAISHFDPASVVLSHRNLMRAAGHDFRLAVVRAYTEKQRQADYVCERLVRRVEDVAPGISKVQVYWEKLTPNLESLREFAAQADIVQFHPGIGHGDGDWASRGDLPPTIKDELGDVLRQLGLTPTDYRSADAVIYFIHGSVSAWRHLDLYRSLRQHIAVSTIDYATELDAAYLPPLVDVGDLRAPLRGDDDPLLIAHTPTDRVACSTEEFLKAAQGLGIPVRLGEGLAHGDVLKLKAECNAGFDHLRGAFSVNTLENAALGLIPLFALKESYVQRVDREGISYPHTYLLRDANGLREAMRLFSENAVLTRAYQNSARSWWEMYFSAEPITKRLTKFYESL